MRATVAPWLDAPLAEFVREARASLAVVVEPSGRVLAQHGFTRSLDVMAICSLVASIHASATALAGQLDRGGFGPLHHGGTGRQVFLAPAVTPGGTLLLLAVFDGRSSLGIVRHFHAAFARAIRDVVEHDPRLHPVTGDFERDLGRNLAVLFGRA